MRISIIIPTYDPSIDRLNRTLQGISNQTLHFSEYEVIIIDNNSKNSFEEQITIPKSLSLTIVKEPRQGLTFARLKGFSVSDCDLIVMVDDDNVLDRDYLKNVKEIFKVHSDLGAIGGNIEPEFESEPAEWTRPFWGKLAIRNLGAHILISDLGINQQIKQYPDFAPVGAGMAIRRIALKNYIVDINQGKEDISDRKGNSLSSSGDNEIVMYVLKSGFKVGFFPELKLVHLIPASRLTSKYLARLNYGIMNSWTKFVLKYSIGTLRPVYKWTVPLRKLKSYLSCKAWRSNVAYIHWQGNCGTFDALAK